MTTPISTAISVEAIVNYPKIVQISGIDTKSKKEYSYPKFSALLFLDKENGQKVQAVVKALAMANPGFKPGLRTLKSKVAAYEERVELEGLTDYIGTQIKFYKDMAKDYTHMHNVKCDTTKMKCTDIYQKPFEISDIQKGDRVFVKLFFMAKSYTATNKDGTTEVVKYILAFVNVLTLLEPQAVEIVQERDDTGHFDSLKNYQDRYANKVVTDIVSADAETQDDLAF